jgi:hypothetical protein
LRHIGKGTARRALYEFIAASLRDLLLGGDYGS